MAALPLILLCLLVLGLTFIALRKIDDRHKRIRSVALTIWTAVAATFGAWLVWLILMAVGRP